MRERELEGLRSNFEQSVRRLEPEARMLCKKGGLDPDEKIGPPPSDTDIFDFREPTWRTFAGEMLKAVLMISNLKRLGIDLLEDEPVSKPKKKAAKKQKRGKKK